MKPITAFVMETVYKLNITSFAAAENHTTWTEKGLYIFMKGEEKVLSFWKKNSPK